jgi:hypothetical protein
VKIHLREHHARANRQIETAAHRLGRDAEHQGFRARHAQRVKF